MSVIQDVLSGGVSFSEAMAKYSIQSATKDRLRIYRKLGSLARAGVPLPRALDSMWNLASRNGKNPGNAEAVALDAWRRSVNNGNTLGDAVAGWIPDRERMLIDAAGAARLDAAIENAANVTEAAQAMSAAIKGGLAYPIFLFLGICVVLWVFGVQVIPAFATVKPMETWTGMSGQMRDMSYFVQNWGIWALLGLIAFVIFLWQTLPWFKGPLRTYLDRSTPPWNMYRMFIGSGFLLSLSALVKAGVPVSEALRRLRASANPWLLERLDAALRRVNNGESLGDALYQSGFDFPDREIVEDLRLYATLGNFDERMEQLAQDWIRDGVAKVQAQAQVMNMVMMVAIGLTVAWLGSGLIELQNTVTSGL